MNAQIILNHKEQTKKRNQLSLIIMKLKKIKKQSRKSRKRRGGECDCITSSYFAVVDLLQFQIKSAINYKHLHYFYCGALFLSASRVFEEKETDRNTDDTKQIIFFFIGWNSKLNDIKYNQKLICSLRFLRFLFRILFLFYLFTFDFIFHLDVY